MLDIFESPSNAGNWMGMIQRIGFTVFVFIAAVIPWACEDFGGPPPRIIPGVSIEGIRLGDSRERVESVLGIPNGVGYVDGVWRTWRAHYYFRNGEKRALIVDFLDTTEAYGPVDKVVVGAGYDGKTSEGIGVGSTRSEIERLWGPPNKTIGNNYFGYANYCFGKRFLQFVLRNDTAIVISTGFFVPCPADTFDTCY